MTDAQMIDSPSEWPRWPLLPLKRKLFKELDEKSLGFILAEEAPPYVVYLATVYDIPSDPRPRTWNEAVAGFTTETYDTIEALTEQWMVD